MTRTRRLVLAVAAVAGGCWLARRVHTAAQRPEGHVEEHPTADLSRRRAETAGEAPKRDGFAGWYGAHPPHLVAVVVSLALTGYVVSLLVGTPDVARIGIWFVAAVVLHDLVLFPVYSLADRGMSTAVRLRGGPLVVPVVNHLRLPALASGILLLIFFPAILQQGEATYLRASGLREGTDYLHSWLLLTAAFFVVSATAYAARRQLAAPPRLGPSDRGGQRSGLSVDRRE